MKNLLIILLFTFSCTVTLAQEKKNKNAKHTIEVNGNCDQCKKRIEKAAYTVAGVKSAIWDLESRQLQVIINEEKSSAADVSKAIAKVGHDTEDVKSTETDYENLHFCCKYVREE